MRYSLEPKNRVYVKGYGFLSCLKRHAKRLNKSVINKIGQKNANFFQKSAIDVAKKASKKQ